MADKYDRQLRLWGPEGQRALMESRICVIGAGPTATETLKNLVLPGCGYGTYSALRLAAREVTPCCPLVRPQFVWLILTAAVPASKNCD